MRRLNEQIICKGGSLPTGQAGSFRGNDNAVWGAWGDSSLRWNLSAWIFPLLSQRRLGSPNYPSKFVIPGKGGTSSTTKCCHSREARNLTIELYYH